MLQKCLIFNHNHQHARCSIKEARGPQNHDNQRQAAGKPAQVGTWRARVATNTHRGFAVCCMLQNQLPAIKPILARLGVCTVKDLRQTNSRTKALKFPPTARHRSRAETPQGQTTAASSFKLYPPLAVTTLLHQHIGIEQDRERKYVSHRPVRIIFASAGSSAFMVMKSPAEERFWY